MVPPLDIRRSSPTDRELEVVTLRTAPSIDRSVANGAAQSAVRRTQLIATNGCETESRRIFFALDGTAFSKTCHTGAGTVGDYRACRRRNCGGLARIPDVCPSIVATLSHWAAILAVLYKIENKIETIRED
jgi:hypothetical protein